MCVLTYIPLGSSDFLITNNRDEATARPKALPPQRHRIGQQVVFFPKDAQAQGTWVATSMCITLVLLNGAFENHTPSPPYKHSRGQVILDFFELKNTIKCTDRLSNLAKEFAESYSFEGLEPFTLVVITNDERRVVTEIRWDSQKVHLTNLDNTKAHIWSSATLYNAQIRQNREQWFAQWLGQNQHQADIETYALEFHKTGGDGDPENDLNMNRQGVLKTHCITQIMKKDHDFVMVFEDLISGQAFRYRII
jgi:uncharacterized protein with NRDE domain